MNAIENYRDQKTKIYTKVNFTDPLKRKRFYIYKE